MSLRFSVPALVVALAHAVALSAAEKFFDFGAFPTGQTPPGFRSVVTGQGKPGDWKILMEDVPPVLAPISPNAPKTAKKAVLAQLSQDLTQEHYPLLISDDEVYGDFSFSTRFKIVSGISEQMAGIAFRIQDEKNYYYIRLSALGNNFRFFKFVDGVLSPPIGKDVPVKKGEWHELRADAKGSQLTFFLDGAQLLPVATDNSFLSGKIGFWTKSDSVAYFTDAKITYTPRENLATALVRDILQHYPRVRGVRIYAPAKDGSGVQVIAASRKEDIGLKGGKVEEDVISRNTMYYGKEKESLVTMPLHDRNGDVVAAVRFEIHPFFGQTEANAIARAMPMIQEMEKRVQASKDLLQ